MTHDELILRVHLLEHSKPTSTSVRSNLPVDAIIQFLAHSKSVYSFNSPELATCRKAGKPVGEVGEGVRWRLRESSSQRRHVSSLKVGDRSLEVAHVSSEVSELLGNGGHRGHGERVAFAGCESDGDHCSEGEDESEHDDYCEFGLFDTEIEMWIRLYSSQKIWAILVQLSRSY